jgi:hypothetical protein
MVLQGMGWLTCTHQYVAVKTGMWGEITKHILIPTRQNAQKATTKSFTSQSNSAFVTKTGTTFKYIQSNTCNLILLATNGIGWSSYLLQYTWQFILYCLGFELDLHLLTKWSDEVFGPLINPTWTEIINLVTVDSYSNHLKFICSSSSGDTASVCTSKTRLQLGDFRE